MAKIPNQRLLKVKWFEPDGTENGFWEITRGPNGRGYFLHGKPDPNIGGWSMGWMPLLQDEVEKFFVEQDKTWTREIEEE